MIKRNKMILCAGLVAMFTLMGSLLIISSIATPKISEQEAMDIAEAEIGGNAEAISADYETDEGSPYYDIVVKNDDGYWEVEVDATTGEVGEIEGPRASPIDD